MYLSKSKKGFRFIKGKLNYNQQLMNFVTSSKQ